MSRGQRFTYDLSDVIMTLDGVPLQGFGEDDAAVFEPNSPLFEMKVGADGEVTRSANNDRSGTLTITLSDSSRSNDLINVKMQLAKFLTLGTSDSFAIMINDLRSGRKLIGKDCWIEQEPNLSFGKTSGDTEWIIKIPNAITNHGGSLTT